MPGQWATNVLESSKDQLMALRAGLPAGGDPRVVVELAGTAKGLIAQRTAAGISATGAPFELDHISEEDPHECTEWTVVQRTSIQRTSVRSDSCHDRR